jgi:mannose-6-phosphate isomerase-like protein (cupin superfamily)
MAGFIINIAEAIEQNDHYRHVLHTAYYGQLILMSLVPGEETGAAVNDLDQFIRFESGHGKVILDGEEHTVGNNWVVVIPAGVEHNVINTSSEEKMKLCSIYTPPEHLPGTVHASKADDIAHRY